MSAYSRADSDSRDLTEFRVPIEIKPSVFREGRESRAEKSTTRIVNIFKVKTGLQY